MINKEKKGLNRISLMYLKNGLNMKRVQREDILDFMTYEDTRDGVRKEQSSIKKDRRIHLGDHLTFLFENTDTIKYQIQEMVRTERIVRESDTPRNKNI